MLELHGLALPALGAVAALGEPAVVVVAVVLALEARDDPDPARGARSTRTRFARRSKLTISLGTGPKLVFSRRVRASRPRGAVSDRLVASELRRVQHSRGATAHKPTFLVASSVLLNVYKSSTCLGRAR